MTEFAYLKGKVIKVWPLRNSIHFQLAPLCWILLRCLLSRPLDGSMFYRGHRRLLHRTPRERTGWSPPAQDSLRNSCPCQTLRGKWWFQSDAPSTFPPADTLSSTACASSLHAQHHGTATRLSQLLLVKTGSGTKMPVIQKHPFNSLQALRALLGAENAPSKAPSSMSPENQCFPVGRAHPCNQWTVSQQM